MSVAIEPCGDTGLICLDAPASTHEIELRFADTPVRQLAKGTFVAALLLASLVAWRIAPQRAPRLAGVARPQPWPQAVALAALVG
ncbi:MAG: hypothetical protein N2439_07740 [Anaerolineae bacterium]|nr:hypothetical protein [Anaerolineae bacterium]